MNDEIGGTSSGKVAQSAAALVVTPTLIALSGLLFVTMVLSHVSPMRPTGPQLLRWGANYGPLTLGGQWWRLLSSMFLHIGVIHLLLNMWCLWDLGGLAERIWGRARFLSVYLMTGVTGAIVSVTWHPFAPSAGASGAIFGIAGALIVFLVSADLPFRRKGIKGAVVSLVAFAAYNLIFGILSPGIDNAAHLGGFSAGLVAGYLLARCSRAMIPVPLLVLLLCVWVSHARGYVVHVERGRAALAAGKTDAAIFELTTTVRQRPKFADAYWLLAEAYVRKSQLAAAESSLRQVVSLQPNNGEARWRLGLVVAGQNRPKEALDIFTGLAKLQPSNANVQVGIAMMQAALGDLESALASFHRAAQLNPNDPQVAMQEGVLALRLKHIDEAIAALSQSVRLQPNNANALASLAQAYQAKGMSRESQAAYDSALKVTGRK